MKSKYLPSREFAYNYTVAMWSVQEFELNLRAIIHTLDFHEWVMELPMRPEEKDRFKTAEQFIDEATLGALIETLDKAGVVKSKTSKEGKKMWQRLKDVCKERNRLAHSYLAEHNFGKLTPEQEEVAICEVKRMAMSCMIAFNWSQSIREELERKSDQVHTKTNEVLGFPIDWESPTRKYVMRKLRVPLPKKA